VSHQPFHDKEWFNNLNLKFASPLSNCVFSEVCIIIHRNVIAVKTWRMQRCRKCLLTPAFQKAALSQTEEESEVLEIVGIFCE